MILLGIFVCAIIEGHPVIAFLLFINWALMPSKQSK